MELLAAYDFIIEIRPGISHKNADILSRRPCLDQACAHSERFEKRYSDTTPGLATKNIGVIDMESAFQGESLMKDGLKRVYEPILEGQDPSDSEKCGTSNSSEEGLFFELSSEKVPECTLTGGRGGGGVRSGTTPQLQSPSSESQNLSLEVESPPSVIFDQEDCGLGCDPRRVIENNNPGEALQLRAGVETQLSCYSRVPETTLGGTLSTSESMDIT